MKKTLLIALFCIPIFVNAQNNRWMYLAKSSSNATILVDTVLSEIKQDKMEEYVKKAGYGSNTVTFWTMSYKRTVKNKKATTIKTIQKIIVDTIENRYQTSDFVAYKNGEVTEQDGSIYDWTDVVPGTIGELFVKFGKSINNHAIRKELVFNASINKPKFLPLL